MTQRPCSRRAAVGLATFLIVPLPVTAQPIVTLTSLLDEMADRDALARWPSPAYRQLQASSYNRASVRRDKPGWFADSDGVSWIREELRDGKREYVIMEHQGPGCITKLWTPFFYYAFEDRVGPRLRIYLDGAAMPVIDEGFIELLTRNDWPAVHGPRPPQRNSFQVPAPFAGFTARAGNLYLPIPFAHSCKITLDDKAFYNIVNYRAYPESTRVESFTLEAYRAAAERLAALGRELLAVPGLPTGALSTGRGAVGAGAVLRLQLQGAGAIRHLEVELDPAVARRRPSILRTTILRILCDGDETVWCPLGDFFSCPNELHAFHTWTRTATADGKLVCRWTQPYRTGAEIRLESVEGEGLEASLKVVTSPWTWDDRSMRFHASWRPDDVLRGDELSDWNFVRVDGRGVHVGDAWTVLNLTDGWWGEGDEKIYFDGAYDRGFPDHFGTGTEDYYGWAGGVNPTRADVFSHPFLANISVGSTTTNSTRGFNICTRLRGLDAIPFERELVFDMEASPGVDQRNRWNLLGYSAVTFWYATPGAKSNRPPAAAEAAKPLMSLEALQRRSAELRKASTD